MNQFLSIEVVDLLLNWLFDSETGQAIIQDNFGRKCNSEEILEKFEEENPLDHYETIIGDSTDSNYSIWDNTEN